jgi:DNA-binding transcriptional LysR family regulator
MLDLNDHHYFVQAVDHGGFAAAGRALDIPKSTFSRRVIELESRLGVRLIERTSRSFVATDVGRAFYRHAKAMLIEAEAAENVVMRRLAEPSGTIRITCSFGMARFLSELLGRFLTEYPKVNLIQYTTNNNVDLVEEGFDVGVRGHGGPLPDSELIQRRLADTPWHAFAAPAYLKEAGVPTQPAELTSHATVALGSGVEHLAWQLSRNGESIVVPIEPRMQSSDMATLKAFAIAGLGIVSLPAYVAREQVATSMLQRVLPEWITQRAQITLVTPSRRGQLPSVRALIDFLVAEFPRIVDGASDL